MDLGGGGTRPHEGESGQGGRFGFLARPGIVAYTGGMQERFFTNLFFHEFQGEHVEQFGCKLLAVQVHESQGHVGEGRGAKRVAFAMQTVGMGELGRLVDRESVQKHGLGVVVVGVQLREPRTQVALGLVYGVRMDGDAGITGGAQGPERSGRNAPVRADVLDPPDPTPIAPLGNYQGTDQGTRPVAETIEFDGPSLGLAGKLQRGHGCEQVTSGKATNSRWGRNPVVSVLTTFGPRRDGGAQSHVDDRLLEARAHGDGHPL